MGRNKGLLPFSGNFEPKSAEPFDGRDRVEFKNDLILESTWLNDDGNVYIYNGIKVTVYNDPDINNLGLYLLLDDDYSDINNWVKIGKALKTDTVIETTGSIINIDNNNNYIGVKNDTYTLNLPSTPVNYFECYIIDLRGDAETNNITINGNGNNINNDTTVIIDTDYGSVNLKFIDDKWYILNLI